MKRLIIATHRRLDEERSGSKTYLLRMMMLAKEAGYSLSILCLPVATFSNRPWGRIAEELSSKADIIWPGTLKLGAHYWSLSPIVWLRFVWRLFQAALEKWDLGPERWRSPWSNLATVPPASELSRAARRIANLEPDAALVEYSSLGPLLNELPKAIGTALLVHDSFAARSELFASQGKAFDYDDAPTFDEEAERMASSDVIFHASLNELARFQKIDGKPSHVWFRPTAPVLRDRLENRQQAELLYIGANQQGSRDAIDHFLSEIWLQVRAGASDATLNIVGPVGASLTSDLITDGVIVHGRVEDLADFAGPDMIGILPTRLMSGISIKVGEYLGMGVPVVAYPAAIDGYGDTLEGIVQTAEDAKHFADTLVTLLSDKSRRRKISDAGLVAAETTLQNPEVISALKKLPK
ncbi:MAG: glycosyltransferase family 4 protein [Pseudomonadota bacterium]